MQLSFGSFAHCGAVGQAYNRIVGFVTLTSIFLFSALFTALHYLVSKKRHICGIFSIDMCVITRVAVGFQAGHHPVKRKCGSTKSKKVVTDT